MQVINEWKNDACSMRREERRNMKDGSDSEKSVKRRAVADHWLILEFCWVSAKKLVNIFPTCGVCHWEVASKSTLHHVFLSVKDGRH